jgi:hypothetical protein
MKERGRMAPLEPARRDGERGRALPETSIWPTSIQPPEPCPVPGIRSANQASSTLPGVGLSIHDAASPTGP